VAAELIYQKGFPPTASYVFKHALIQDTAYQSLLRSTRQQMHQRIAVVLLARFPAEADARPEYVAHHYTEAGLMREAAEYWRRAGQLAAQRSAFSEAIAHFRRGLEVLAALPESADRDRLELHLQLALAFAIVPLRGYAAPDAERSYARAAELADTLQDTTRLIDALWGLCVASWVGRDVRRGRALAERCLSLAHRTGNDVERLASHHVMACTSMALGRFREARYHFEQVLVWYGPDPRPEISHRFGGDLKINALQFLAPTLWFLGYPEQALACCNELSEFWPDTPFLYNRIWNSVSLVQLLVLLRQPQGYEAQIDSGLALCQEQDFHFMRLVISTLRGGRLAQQGAVEQAIADIQQGIAVHRASGVGFSVPVFFCFLADALLSIKEAAPGLDAVAQGLAAAQQSGEPRVDAELHRLRGELLLTQVPPDGAEAEPAFRQALEIAQGQEARSFELRTATSLARLWQSQGKHRQARDLLAPIYAWFTEGFDTKDLIEAKALLEELRA
jgi:predicted ATPase